MNRTAVTFLGVPTFFRACCREASYGGANSYKWTGYELARHTISLLAYEDVVDKQAKLEELHQALRSRSETSQGRQMDGAAVIAWYEREFPCCLELVPSARRSQFAEGIRECWENGDLD